MYPHERSLVEKLKDEPFSLIGVNSDADRDALKDTLKRENITWRSFFDGSTDGPIAKAWNVSGWPTTYVIDAQGVIRARNVRGEALESAIEAALADAKASAGK